MTKFDKRFKIHEYEMKITKMAGYLADYYIDRAIESDDYSVISGYLIDYFANNTRKTFDVGYLYSKYNEYGLNDKIEDIDFDIDEWYKIKYEADNNIDVSGSNLKRSIEMTEDEYIQYMIEKRKKEINE